MFTVAHRAEIPCSLRPQALTTQAGGNDFHIEGFPLTPQFISKAWCTITLFCMLKNVINQAVASLPELLEDTYHIKPVTPGISAAAGDTEPPARRLDAELSLMFFDEDILHYQRAQPASGLHCRTQAYVVYGAFWILLVLSCESPLVESLLT